MNWIDIALFCAVLVGLAAGGFMVARSPAFWVGMGLEVFRRMLPVVAKRMSPEKEKEFHDCVRRGGEWDHSRKRCKY